MLFNDPLFNLQWHLHNGSPSGKDLNVLDVMDEYSGDGVTVFISDDGVDYRHADLGPNYNNAIDQDPNNGDNDAIGDPMASHGTAVAGIIGADANNGIGVVGIAHESTLVGWETYNLISSRFVNDAADGLRYAADNGGDIVNMSQGVANTPTTAFGAGGIAVSAYQNMYNSIDYAVDNGRGGLGVVIVKAGGNSRSTGYDMNASGWTQNDQQVVVAALDQNGFVSDYSTYGAVNLVSGFGTPGEVVTTDRIGSEGWTPTDYRDDFNGTSAAAPMVAGIVALMLEANPDLGWRDVHEILAASARHTGSSINASSLTGDELFFWGINKADSWNGGGMHFSNDYGFGLVNGTAAVRMAETWLEMNPAATSNNEVGTFEDDFHGSPVLLPDGNVNGLTFQITESQNIEIDRLVLNLGLAAGNMPDLYINLTSPSGTTNTLIYNAGQGTGINGAWGFNSQMFRGEMSAGTWTVQIADVYANGSRVQISDINLLTAGAVANNQDEYVFTDDFSMMAFFNNTRQTITDTDGGSDWVNAAGVASASTIDLRGSTNSSNIDATSLTIQNVENAIGGDYGDTITGTSVANKLFGSHGADVLDGGAGNDVLDGGTGNDVLKGADDNDVVKGAQGNDLLFGGNGNDLIFGGSGVDKLYGGSGFDKIFGGDNNDIANGGADNDIINTGGGNDLVFGQSGNDLVFLQAGNDKAFAGDGNDKIFGGDGNDTINLGAGHDEAFGGAGIDLIIGATGNDTLSGGGERDTFVFAANQGIDRITDFTGIDKIDIAAFGVTNSGASNQDWRDATTSVGTSGGGSNVTLDWDGGGTLILLNTTIASLTDSDFLF